MTNKKKLMNRIAGSSAILVTALGSGAGAVLTQAPSLASTVFAAEGRAVTNIEGTGKLEILTKPKVEGTKIYRTPQFDTNQSYDFTVNDSNLKEGDYIPIQGEGLNLLADDVRVGETVVGKLVYVKTDLNLPKSGNWYASEENINDSTHKLLGTQHWKIVFNKEIEKFQNPKIKIDIKNKRIEGHKNYKPNGGADITLSMKFGDKVLINETVKVEGLDKPKEKNGTFFGSGEGWWTTKLDSTGKLVTDNFFPMAVTTPLNEPGQPNFEVGDLIEWNFGEGSDNFVVTPKDNVKLGDTLNNVDTLDNFNLTSYKVNKNTGAILVDDNNVKFKLVEAGKNKIVVQVIRAGAPGTISNFGNNFKAEITSTKGVDLTKMVAPPVAINTKLIRNGKVLAEQNSNFTPKIAGVAIGANANLVKRGSVVVTGVDEQGKNLFKAVVAVNNEKVDTDYKIDESKYNKVEGYTYSGLKQGSAPVSGKIIEGTQTVTLLFKKNQEEKPRDDVKDIKTTRFLEEGTNKVLKPEQKGDKFLEAGTIDGYTFVKSDVKGDVTTHYFKKAEEPKKPETPKTPEVPKTEEPKKEEPKTPETPKVEEPKKEEPKAPEVPKTEEPKKETPKETPKVEPKKVETPKTADVKTPDKKDAVKTGANASAAIAPLLGIAGGAGAIGAAVYVAKKRKK